MKTRSFVFILIGLVSISLVGCGSTQPRAVVEKVPADSAQTSPAGERAGGSATPLAPGTGLELGRLDDPASPLSKRIIYFDFDSSEMGPDVEEIVIAHGQFLSSNPSARVRLEGHADERGSREYNLGLGERRAQSVSQILKLQGVAVDQIELISYGEELPAAFGHDEESWQLNRRVEIVYLGEPQ